MFDTNACAIELLKMKNSEDFRKEIAAGTSSTAPSEVPAESSTEPASVKQVESSVSLPTTDSIVQSNEEESVEIKVHNFDSEPPSLIENSTGVTEFSSQEDSSNSVSNDSQNEVLQMEVDPVTNSSESQVDLKSDQKETSVELVAEVISEVNSCSNQDNKVDNEAPMACEKSEEIPTSTRLSNLTIQDEQVPSTSAKVDSSNGGGNLKLMDDDSVRIAMASVISSESSSSSEDEDEGIPVNDLSKDNMGSDNNDPAEHLIIKRNSQYLLQRCFSLVQRVQGMMLHSTKKHVARQLQAVAEHPGFNSAKLQNQNINRNGASSSYQNHSTTSKDLTKQSLSDIQFTVSLMKSILRETMGCHLEADDDSSTDESDTDDEEVVLPDESLMDLEQGSEFSPYLPVENNPFIEAVKLEKMYETKRTSLDFSINECEYSLTKSAVLRKHCKARKPLFRLEKPSTSSSNVINIPVDSTSSVKFYHDSKPTTVRKVSDMMHDRRSSLEQDRIKIGGNKSDTPSTSISDQSTGNDTGNSSAEDNAFIPSIKSLGSGGISLLGVEFVNSSDPSDSASRCAAIKRPAKNRKVFQLGGIQNIFRDNARLPTVRCSCFGRNELCAVCLGRAKKKAEINHVFMNQKDKLALLDETFHKSLSLPEDVPLEVLLVTNSTGNSNPPFIQPSNSIQELIHVRSKNFPPDFLETGPKPKRPKVYGIKPYVEVPVTSPKKDGRYDDMCHINRKRTQPRKSMSAFDDRDFGDFTGKGLGRPSRERKDSLSLLAFRRNRNQEFDIDNIVIPYSMAASTRVEQLVYKPIETPRWRVLEYSEIFSSSPDEEQEEGLEDMTNAAFLERHDKCEIEEKKRFVLSLQKALNATRKTRRLDSTGRSESMCEPSGPMIPNYDSLSASVPSPPVHSPGKSTKDKEVTAGNSKPAEESNKSSGATTPVIDQSTVITEAMATQALKSLFKIGRRRTASASAPVPISTTTITTSTTSLKDGKTETEEEEAPQVDRKCVEPWPTRSFPLSDSEYKEMVEVMHTSYVNIPEQQQNSNDLIVCDEDSFCNL